MVQSCVTEDQKYQGALYKAKPSKSKSVSIAAPPKPKQPYVEDVPDVESTAVAIVNVPPHAPSPPPSAAPQAVNVFDFLVNDETPNASRVSLGGSKEQMCMVDHAQPLFKSLSASPSQDEDDHFASNGFTYGEAPVRAALEYEHYTTPAPKALTKYDKSKHTKSTDKKRKRQVEDLDLSRASRSSADLDEEMLDADSGPPVLHSGLTGGLNRLLSASTFPPSPDYSNGSGADPSPLSPAKRKRQGNIRLEKRGRYAGQLVKVRKPRRSSDESRPRKHHRAHKHEEGSSQDQRSLKAIEYHPRGPSPSGNDGNQLVVYRSRAEMFLSFVTKGPDSTQGYSLNKALKRYHRERGLGSNKHEEEKELWKSLRLKRNERGEIVLFTGEAE